MNKGRITVAFGINRDELKSWKQKVKRNEIAFLTHYWLDDRFPGCHTVTKVGCRDIEKLISWGEQYGLEKGWIHERDKFPHYDLFGNIQLKILKREQKWDHIEKFQLKKGTI